MRKIITLIFALILASIMVAGSDFLSHNPINMLNNPIHNASDINATQFYQDGNEVVDVTSASTLNVNSSIWWDNENSQSDLNVNSSTNWDGETSQSDLNVNSSNYWANITATTQITRLGTIVTGTWQATQIASDYIASLVANKLTNISHLNYKILLDADNITNPFWINISEESNLNVNSSTWWAGIDEISDLNNAITLSKDNITDENWIEDSQEPNLNVNSSTWWAGIDEISDLNNAITLSKDNITDENWIEDSQEPDLNVNSSTWWDNENSQSNLNVNSSEYWDNLNSPGDIDAGEINDDGTYYDNASNIDATDFNLTANWLFGKLNWSSIQNKFIESVGKFFLISGTELRMNTTELNATIDDRVSVSGNYSAGLGIKLTGTNYSVEAGNGLKQETDGLAVEDAGINNSLLRWKTGQNLTTTDSVKFNSLNLTGTLQENDNLTIGKGWNIPQGEFGCFDASCNHYIYENSSGVLIIE